MSPVCSRWLLLVLAVGAISAAETTAPPAGPPAEDSIAVARREFDLIKSARQPQPATHLPRVSLPELPSGAMDAPVRSQPAARPPRSNSANWLVEAMQKARGSIGENPPRGDDLRSERSGDEVERAAADPRAAANPARPHRDSADGMKEQKPNTAVFNPLASYLGSWMTPQDYTLLGPSIQNSAGSRDALNPDYATPNSPVAPATSAGIAGSAVAPGEMRGWTMRKPAAPAAPRENPYLAGLNPIALMPPKTPSGGPTVQPPPAGKSLFSPPAPTEPGRSPPSTLPDFVKSQADEKYFKPLKRF